MCETLLKLDLLSPGAALEKDYPGLVDRECEIRNSTTTFRLATLTLPLTNTVGHATFA